MAWVRTVRTASGSTAVQIAESVDGRRRIVRHVGSARDESELGVLLERARELLADDLQGVLDLGMQVPQRVRRMAPSPGELTLFGPSPGRAQPSATSRAQVLRTSCRTLYDALACVYTQLGFDALGDACFKDLVIARVVEPTSLLDVDRVLADLGRASASLSTRKRTLRRAQGRGYRDQLAAASFTHAATHGDVSLVLYDVTTLYFEAEKEDDLRKVGFSNYAEVVVMPMRSSVLWCSCWSGAGAGVGRAA